MSNPATKPQVTKPAFLYYISFTFTEHQSKDEVARGVLPREQSGASSVWSIDKLDSWDKIQAMQEWIRTDLKYRSVVIMVPTLICSGDHDFDAE